MYYVFEGIISSFGVSFVVYLLVGIDPGGIEPVGAELAGLVMSLSCLKVCSWILALSFL